MNRILYSLLILVCLSCSNDSKPPQKKKRPRSEWKFIFEENTFYASKQYKNDTIVASFNYFNNTGKIQIIDTIRTACGCTSTSYKHAPINSNEKGTLKVLIDTYGMEGYIDKTAVVYFRNQEPVLLHIRGKIV